MITLSFWLKIIYSPFWELNGLFNFYKLETLSPKGALCQALMKLTMESSSWWGCLNVIYAFSLSRCCYFLPLKKNMVLRLKNTKSLQQRKLYCQLSLVEIFEVKFLMSSRYFPSRERKRDKAISIAQTRILFPYECFMSILVDFYWVVNIILLFRFLFAFKKYIIIHLKKLNFL